MDPGDRIGLLVSGRQDVIQIQCRGISRSGTGISDNQLADIFDTKCMCDVGDGHTTKGLQEEELASQLIQDCPVHPNSNGSTETDERQVETAVHRPVFYWDNDQIEKLNDIHWNQCYCMALEKAKARLDQARRTDFSVIDMSKGASLLSVQALKLGASQVFLAAEDSSHRDLLQQIAQDNGVCPGLLKFPDPECVGSPFEDLDRTWSVLLCEVVDPCGALQQQVLEDLSLAR